MFFKDHIYLYLTLIRTTFYYNSLSNDLKNNHYPINPNSHLNRPNSHPQIKKTYQTLLIFPISSPSPFFNISTDPKARPTILLTLQHYKPSLNT